MVSKMTEKTDIEALREECAQWAKDNFSALIDTRMAENGDGNDYAAWDMVVLWRAWRHLSGKLEAERQRADALGSAALAMRDDMRVAREELAGLRGEQDHGDSTVYMMPNVFASLVNTARDVALEYKNAQCLRDALSRELKGYFTLSRQPKPVVVRKIGHIDHDGGEHGKYFVELTDSAEIGRAVYVIEEGEAAGIVVQNGECETSFRGSSISSTEAFRENYKSSTNCPKCGGRGAYHCPQMLGTVECECGIVVKDGE